MSRSGHGLATHELGRTDGGPALVLMHGNGDSGTCWPDAARRWGTAYRLVGVDARGHGDSPRFGSEQLDRPGETFADDAERLLDEVAADTGSGPVIAVGHSLGAGSLTAVLARRPGLLAAAVLIDPPWDSPLVIGARPDVGAARVEFIEACQRSPAAALRECEERNPQWPEGEREAWLEAKLHLDLAYIATGSGRPDTPWPELVAAVRTPTLVVTGDPDQCLVGRATQARLAEIGNPAVEVQAIAGADHYVRQCAADAFHALVDPWIEGRFGR